MYNSSDIQFDSFGISSVSLSRKAVIVYDADALEARQEFKQGKHFYRIIAYPGKLYKAMIGLSLSFKIPRAGVQGQAAAFSLRGRAGKS